MSAKNISELSKEDLIETSKTWSEAQENMFRKYLNNLIQVQYVILIK